MDETGFALDPIPKKTDDVHRTKNVLSTCSGSKSQNTVLACVSGSGQAPPPMIIWSKKRNVPRNGNRQTLWVLRQGLDLFSPVSQMVREVISEVYTCNKAYTFAGGQAYIVARTIAQIHLLWRPKMG